MAKNEEIKALHNFIKELKSIDEDSNMLYFCHLIQLEGLIESNIRNDFSWYTGLYYAKDSADGSANKMLDEIAALKEEVKYQKAMVKDLEYYDVRSIKNNIRNLELDITSQTDHLAKTKRMLQSNIEMLDVNEETN